MESLKLIYKILSMLEGAMGCDGFDHEAISANKLGVSEGLWKSCMEMLIEEGYVKGAFVERTLGNTYIEYDNVRISLAGLEYLKSNSTMQKIKNMLGGVTTVVGTVSGLK